MSLSTTAPCSAVCCRQELLLHHSLSQLASHMRAPSTSRARCLCMMAAMSQTLFRSISNFFALLIWCQVSCITSTGCAITRQVPVLQLLCSRCLQSTLRSLGHHRHLQVLLLRHLSPRLWTLCLVLLMPSHLHLCSPHPSMLM